MRRRSPSAGCCPRSSCSAPPASSLLLDLVPPRDTKTHLGGIALGGIVAALLAAVTRWGAEQRAFRDMVLLDNYALFVSTW